MTRPSNASVALTATPVYEPIVFGHSCRQSACVVRYVNKLTTPAGVTRDQRHWVISGLLPSIGGDQREEFDLDGKYLGEISDLGRIYSFKLAGDALWAAMQSFDQPPGSPGWIVKLDSETGRILGHLDVPEILGLHSIEISPLGEPVTVPGNQLLWFRQNESAR
jgi:hypothetical protein